MAKSKKVQTGDIEDSLIKEFGNVFQSADSLRTNPASVIRTTPQLDFILGGGVPEGSFMLITGQPKLGKSSVALHIASQAQKVPWKIYRDGKEIDFGDRTVYYFDIEGRIKERDIFSNTNLDLDPDRFKLIKSSVDKIIDGEEFIDIGEQLIRNKRGGVFIFDSFSALCTSARKEADIKKRYRDETSLLLSAFCKRIAQVIPVNKSLVIGITHRIANQGPGMSMWSEASGQKVQYQADIKLKGMYTEKWEVSNNLIGQKVFWECQTSALGPPGLKADCKLRYAYGYDEAAELVDLCCDLNLLKKSGSWIYHEKDTDKEQKFQGVEKCAEFLRSDPELFNRLRHEIDVQFGFDKLIGSRNT